MDYSWEDIGARIKTERKKLGYTQQKLADEVLKENKNIKVVSRQEISRWEKGAPIIHLENLIALCKIFDCSISYLFCDYDAQILKMENVTNELGLSPKSIENLRMYKKNDWGWSEILSELSEHDGLINSMCRYIYNNSISMHSHQLSNGSYMSYEMNEDELEELRLQVLFNEFRDFITNLKTKMNTVL